MIDERARAKLNVVQADELGDRHCCIAIDPAALRMAAKIAMNQISVHCDFDSQVM
ncbi:MAG: hypothetical protein P0Y66_14360 [Candidatus Kaistia colombiensis]|nr:MAG: hypothetical protein P0Y66_14360 [Kaistia sp.]